MIYYSQEFSFGLSSSPESRSSVGCAIGITAGETLVCVGVDLNPVAA